MHKHYVMRDSKFLQHYCWRLEAAGYTGLLDWKWRHHCPLKHWEPLAYWHSGLSQITGVFKWWRLFCNFHQTPVISCLLGPNILLIVHLYVTVSILSGQRDQVYYPFKVADEIIVLFWAGNKTLSGLELVVVSIRLFSFTVNVILFISCFS
jgi:hypothetical protein